MRWTITDTFLVVVFVFSVTGYLSQNRARADCDSKCRERFNFVDSDTVITGITFQDKDCYYCENGLCEVELTDADKKTVELSCKPTDTPAMYKEIKNANVCSLDKFSTVQGTLVTIISKTWMPDKKPEHKNVFTCQ